MRERRGLGETPTLDELRAFVQLAEALHFGRAARRLGLARSSLSESIRRLEGKLRVVLFDRTSRRVALTAHGRRLLPRARGVLHGVEGIAAAAGEESEPRQPALRIGIEANGFAEMTRPLLDGFRRRHPHVAQVLREFPGRPEAFFDLRLDVALTRSPTRDERMVVHEMASEPRGMLVAADHPRAGDGEVAIADFLDDLFVAIGGASRDYWMAFEHFGGVRPRVGAEAFTMQEVIHAVDQLGLVTTAGCSIARSYPLPGLAFARDSRLSPVVMGVVTCVGDDRPLVRDFVAIARAVVAETAPAWPDFTVLPAIDRSAASTVGAHGLEWIAP
ncbi:MAG: LysR family transcriptional regulator [Thermoleophilia bacterium]